MIRMAVLRPVAVSMAYVAVALLGIAAWSDIPIELLPDTQLPQLSINASWRGASPETTEAFLTSPLEAAVQQVQGVDSIRSVSSEAGGAGQASLTVKFARDTDMDFARLELSERLAALEEQLPEGVQPEVTPYVPDEFEEQNSPVLAYTVTGPYTLDALYTHVEEVVAPVLRQLDGVASIDARGGRERLIELVLDPMRIRALGLPLETVANRVRQLEYVQEAGQVESGGLLRSVAIRDRAESAEAIRETPVLTTGGRVVRMKDLGTVRNTYEDATSYYRIDGRPAVRFAVYREIGANSVAMADVVKARLAEIENLHPAGVRLILDDDQSEDIRAQLSDLRFRALFAAGVIFLVLLAFLRSARSAGIVFVTIAFSILITVNLIYFAGFTLNVLTLMGLAMGFGLIVDNAIVVLENVYRHIVVGGESARVAAERGAREVLLPILAATVTTLVVLVPFVYLQEELRVYYVPLAIVVGFSLLASLFVAFTFIPSLAGRVLGPGSMGGRGAAAAMGAGSGGMAADGGPARPPVYVRAYRRMVQTTLRFPWSTVVLAMLMLGGSYYLFDKYVNRGVVWGAWGSSSTYIQINIQQPQGEELRNTDALTRYFENRLAAMPEIERFVTNVYPERASVRVTFPEDIETTQIPVAIKEQMVAFSHQFGGSEVRVYGYGPSFYGGGSSPPNYSIKVLGYNYQRVQDIAEDLATRLRRNTRIQDVDPNASGRWYQRDKATEIVLDIDRDRLARYDLSAADVLREVGSAVRSSSGGNIRIAGEEARFEAKLEGFRDMNQYDLAQLLVPSPRGSAVRLGEVATLREREVLARITRENQQYERSVAYEFRGPRKLGDQIHESVIAATRLPPGYRLEGREEWSWSSDEKSQIYMILGVSILLIFMVSAALFESLRQPMCVLLTVPMALVGVFLIFFYTGANFTREAYIGVIMMGGIVVNNAILLVDHVNQLRKRGELDMNAALIRGTLERVRPILMTSATTIFGLLPLVLFSESANSNIWNALGYALIGGLASSTIFVLTITPALYLIFERGPDRRRREAAVARSG